MYLSNPAIVILFYQVSFGHVYIPSDFVAPAEHDLNQMFGFYPPVHDVSADGVYVVDDKTIRIENLNYDGNGPGEGIKMCC